MAPLTHGYFSINIQLDSINCGSKTVFPIRGWSLRMRRADCTVYGTSHKGLEHPWVSVSVGGVLEPVSLRYRGMTVVELLGSQQLYADFQLHRGWHP